MYLEDRTVRNLTYVQLFNVMTMMVNVRNVPAVLLPERNTYCTTVYHYNDACTESSPHEQKVIFLACDVEMGIMKAVCTSVYLGESFIQHYDLGSIIIRSPLA